MEVIADTLIRLYHAMQNNPGFTHTILFGAFGRSTVSNTESSFSPWCIAKADKSVSYAPHLHEMAEMGSVPTGAHPL